MHPPAIATVEATSPDSQLDSLLAKVIPFARAADALARRSAGKVQTLATLALLSAMWIAYACASQFEWSLVTSIIVFAVMAIPSLALWKMYGMLSSAVGLPQRITSAAARLYGKATEYREHYATRGQPDWPKTKPKFKQLWTTAKSMLEARSLSDEAQQIVSLAGGALVLANPIFAIVLTCTSAIACLLILIGASVGLAYLL